MGDRLQTQYEQCVAGSCAAWNDDCHVARSACRNKFASVVVTHDRKAMLCDDKSAFTCANTTVQRNAFHCAREGDECKCRCDQHPTCCALENKVLGQSSAAADAHAGINTAAIDNMAGNRFLNVQTKQDCCNLCTNHPSCSGWVYDSENVCLLKQGTLTFADNVASDQITTWAGRPSGTSCDT